METIFGNLMVGTKFTIKLKHATLTFVKGRYNKAYCIESKDWWHFSNRSKVKTVEEHEESQADEAL